MDEKTFLKLGWHFGRFNGTAGYIKLFPQGSVVIVPMARTYRAMSPRKSRVRAGVLVTIGDCKGGKALRKWLLSLDAIARMERSWIWEDAATNSLTSQVGLRKVRKLHWKSGAHVGKANPTRYNVSQG
jgi:hypothetical protein